jgi:hypothetical protein
MNSNATFGVEFHPSHGFCLSIVFPAVRAPSQDDDIFCAIGAYPEWGVPGGGGAREIGIVKY